MRVFIVGATGVLGRRLVEESSARGHDVVGLTRDERGDSLVSNRGGEPRRGDVLDKASLLDCVDGADAVVHAATKIPTDTTPDDEDWALNDRVRRDGAENLVAAAEAADVDRFVQQSIVWVARQPDGRAFDEDVEPNPDRSTQSALDAERIVMDGADRHGFDPVVLRGGYFYAADAAHTRMFGERLLEGRLPILGRGLLGREDATLSFVHADDVARGFADAIEGEATGVFHVVDDEPVTYAGFIRTLCDRLATSTPRRLPAWLGRYFVDDNLVRLLTRSMPTSNERFREAFGWAPTYSTVQEGLDQVVDEWEESGVTQPTPAGYDWQGTDGGRRRS